MTYSQRGRFKVVCMEDHQIVMRNFHRYLRTGPHVTGHKHSATRAGRSSLPIAAESVAVGLGDTVLSGI